MNIFYLDNDPEICAAYHCNKHVVKMILETAQILSTTHYLNHQHSPWMMKPTHVNHPCVKWALKAGNYYWLSSLGLALCKEYTHRYRKVHQKEATLTALSLSCSSTNMDYFTEPPLCMPEQYKLPSVIDSYRNYYRLGKTKLLIYTNRERPYWL